MSLIRRQAYIPTPADWADTYNMLCMHCAHQTGCDAIEDMIDCKDGSEWPESGWVTDPGSDVTCLSYQARQMPTLSPEPLVNALEKTKPAMCRRAEAVRRHWTYNLRSIKFFVIINCYCISTRPVFQTGQIRNDLDDIWQGVYIPIFNLNYATAFNMSFERFIQLVQYIFARHNAHIRNIIFIYTKNSHFLIPLYGYTANCCCTYLLRSKRQNGKNAEHYQNLIY